MKKHEIALQELKGIGTVLSHRLCQSNYVSITKVASAHEKGLGRITGISALKAHTISIQARKLAEQAEKNHHTWSGDGEASDQQAAQETIHNLKG